MRAVVQRVTRGRVTVEGQTSGEIGRGVVVLLGVGQDDGPADAEYLARKVAGLRIFEDGQGKMNLALADVGGQALVVSQFTLYGDCRRGNRPSFSTAAPAEKGKQLYLYFVEKLRETGIAVQTGVFQAHMQVEIINDGPVTLLLDSAKNF